MTLLASIQKDIIDAVSNNDFSAVWKEVVYTRDGNTIRVSFMNDALIVPKYGRVCVTSETAQKLADLLDASLLTTFLADVLWLNSDIKILPKPQPIAADVKAGLNHSSRIDADLQLHSDFSRTKLVSTVGKHWCLTNQLAKGTKKAVNYGGHISTKFVTNDKWAGIKVYKPKHARPQNDFYVIQEPATAHNIYHVDYSQTCQLVSQYVFVNDKEYRLSDILTTPMGKLFASEELKHSRHPDVEKTNTKVVLMPEYIEVLCHSTITNVMYARMNLKCFKISKKKEALRVLIVRFTRRIVLLEKRHLSCREMVGQMTIIQKRVRSILSGERLACRRRSFLVP